MAITKPYLETDPWSVRSKSVLARRLTAVIPQGHMIGMYHISTQPVPCDPLYAQAPGHPVEETTREKHFLLVTLAEIPTGFIPVYGIEVLVYHTSTLTTIFVSKADSTGFMESSWPSYPWAMSPMTAIASTFLRFLADVMQKPDKRVVMSLFARSESTYLFPGSGDNQGKSILSDTKLIKWWARVMNIVMDLDQSTYDGSLIRQQKKNGAEPARSEVYLRIPGYSAAETKPFVPRSLKESSPFRSVSLAADPFKAIAPHPSGPVRCMVPHFYDDPKTRFAEELDGYDNLDANGDWSSVNTLNGFWDMMQYRQEFAAGKLVGFVWGVFTPKAFFDGDRASKLSSTVPLESVTGDSVLNNDESVPASPLKASEPPSCDAEQENDTGDSTSVDDKSVSASPSPSSTPSPIEYSEYADIQEWAKALEKEVLEDSIADAKAATNNHMDFPQTLAQRAILGPTEYDEAMDVLASGDFSDTSENGEACEYDAALTSTERWIEHVCALDNYKRFGYVCLGELEEPETQEPTDKEGQSKDTPSATKEVKPHQQETGSKRTLSEIASGEVEKEDRTTPRKTRNGAAEDVHTSPVKVLTGSMLRKKPKLETN